MDTDIWTKIILLVLVLHFVAGFAYLVYKLSPKKNSLTNKEEEEG
jgi:Tfp pilus assembly protein PilO